MRYTYTDTLETLEIPWFHSIHPLDRCLLHSLQLPKKNQSFWRIILKQSALPTAVNRQVYLAALLLLTCIIFITMVHSYFDARIA